jgi:hypothetical protein
MANAIRWQLDRHTPEQSARASFSNALFFNAVLKPPEFFNFHHIR